jgi:regulator of sigma E protease
MCRPAIRSRDSHSIGKGLEAPKRIETEGQTPASDRVTDVAARQSAGAAVALAGVLRYAERLSMLLKVLFGALGLGLLMVVHELGHHLVARAFHMRVVKFSIGFGPALWRFQPEGSQTVYQVALIPFVAYVQIAGMNPFEEADPNDKSSYANASVFARISTIFAGPFANYLFASVLFFAAFVIGGKLIPSLRIDVMPGSAAASAKLESGDRMVMINGHALKNWDEMRTVVRASANKPLLVQVDRKGHPVSLTVTPKANSKDGHGELGVESISDRHPIPFSEAIKNAVVKPAEVAAGMIYSLAGLLTGREKLELSGPLRIVSETGKAAALGIDYFFAMLGVLSTVLGIFNLLPVPALDGGRLIFLGYEAVTRRRPDARLEASIHTAGLFLLLVLIAFVTLKDLRTMLR